MHDVEKEAVMPLFVTLNYKVVKPRKAFANLTFYLSKIEGPQIFLNIIHFPAHSHRSML